MFTGIIKGTGKIKSFDHDSSVLSIYSEHFSDEAPHPGASIAIDGVCLTASHFDTGSPCVIGFDLGNETKRCTLLTQKKSGDLVNIEFALKLGSPVDGHIVQGHVDGIVQLKATQKLSDGILFTFSYPKDLAPLIVCKGSIAVNGVSLTINAVHDSEFSVCLVPFTIAHTSFRQSRIDDHFHIETDVIGRYVNRLNEIQLRRLVAPQKELNA